MTNDFMDNTAKSRFEYHVDGGVVFADYTRHDNRVSILHVEAPIALRGTGAAGHLMQHIVDVAKQEGFKIKPICGYAIAWLKKHPNYNDLLI